jgi:diketogulonate reductase-like aldo/keto reductase
VSLVNLNWWKAMTNSLTRRRFAFGIALTPMVGMSMTSSASTVASDRSTRAVPSSSERIPAIGLGTYQSFDINSDEAELAKARDVLTAFIADGGGMIDSSPMYGAAEAVVGQLSFALPDANKLFVATKVWTSGRASGVSQMEASFAKLRVKRIDLMQVHNLQDTATHLSTLAAWRKEGRVRYLGVTHYHSGAYSELEAAIKKHKPDFVQLNYSIAEREAEQRILTVAKDNGVAVIVNRPFAQGALFSKVRGQAVPEWAKPFANDSWAQFFLKFIIAHPAVTCAIPATRNIKHLGDNLLAMRGRLPDATELAKMREWAKGI